MRCRTAVTRSGGWHDVGAVVHRAALGWAATLLVLLSTLEKLSQARELCELLMKRKR